MALGDPPKNCCRPRYRSPERAACGGEIGRSTPGALLAFHPPDRILAVFHIQAVCGLARLVEEKPAVCGSCGGSSGVMRGRMCTRRSCRRQLIVQSCTAGLPFTYVTGISATGRESRVSPKRCTTRRSTARLAHGVCLAPPHNAGTAVRRTKSAGALEEHPLATDGAGLGEIRNAAMVMSASA